MVRRYCYFCLFSADFFFRTRINSFRSRIRSVGVCVRVNFAQNPEPHALFRVQNPAKRTASMDPACTQFNGNNNNANATLCCSPRHRAGVCVRFGHHFNFNSSRHTHKEFMRVRAATKLYTLCTDSWLRPAVQRTDGGQRRLCCTCANLRTFDCNKCFGSVCVFYSMRARAS